MHKQKTIQEFEKKKRKPHLARVFFLFLIAATIVTLSGLIPSQAEINVRYVYGQNTVTRCYDTEHSRECDSTVYMTSINFWNGTGWEQIDSHFEEGTRIIQGKTYQFYSENGLHHTYLKENFGEQDTLLYDFNSKYMTFEPTDIYFRDLNNNEEWFRGKQEVNGVTDANRVVYVGAFGTYYDVFYDNHNEMIKEYIVIPEYPELQYPDTFDSNITFDVDYEIEIDNELELWIDGEEWNRQNTKKTKGNVQVKNESGAVLFELNKPIIYENNGTIIFGEQEFQKKGNKLIQTIKIPYNWMNETWVEYPIIIDPTVEDTVTTANEDVYTDYSGGRPPPVWERMTYTKFYPPVVADVFGNVWVFNVTKGIIYLNMTTLGVGTGTVSNCTGEWVESSSHATVYGLPCSANEPQGSYVTLSTGLLRINVLDSFRGMYNYSNPVSTGYKQNFTWKYYLEDFKASNVLVDNTQLAVGDNMIVDVFSSREDTAEATNSPYLNYTFDLDYDLPYVNWTFPETYENGSTQAKDYIVMNVTIIEEHLDNLTFTLVKKNTSGEFEINVTSWYTYPHIRSNWSVELNFTSLEDAEYLYNVTIVDKINVHSTHHHNVTDRYTVTLDNAVSDSCTPPNGEDETNWDIDCADNCNITTSSDSIPALVNLTGVGNFTINDGVLLEVVADQQPLKIRQEDTCRIRTYGSGRFK